MNSAEKLECIKLLMDLRQEGKISGPAVAVGLAIVENAGDDGRCSLSRADIGARAGIQRLPTISAKLTELRTAGFMTMDWSCRINSYALPVRDNITPSLSKHNAKRYESTLTAHNNKGD